MSTKHGFTKYDLDTDTETCFFRSVGETICSILLNKTICLFKLISITILLLGCHFKKYGDWMCLAGESN